MGEILYKLESYKIIGVCMEVHKELGTGFKEAVYKEAIALEFKELDIPFSREKRFKIDFKGKSLRHQYPADFIVFESIILEVKAVPLIINPFVAQTINYLKASGLKLGLLSTLEKDRFLTKE